MKLRREGISKGVHQQMANARGKLRTVFWIQSKEMVSRRKEPSTGANLLRESDYFSLNQGVNWDKCPQTRLALVSFCLVMTQPFHQRKSLLASLAHYLVKWTCAWCCQLYVWYTGVEFRLMGTWTSVIIISAFIHSLLQLLPRNFVVLNVEHILMMGIH